MEVPKKLKTLKDVTLQFTSTSRLKEDDIEYIYSAAIGNIRQAAREWIKDLEEPKAIHDFSKSKIHEDGGLTQHVNLLLLDWITNFFNLED